MLYAHAVGPFQTIQAWLPHGSRLLTLPLKIIWIRGHIVVLIQLRAACAFGRSAPLGTSHPPRPRRAAGSSVGTLANTHTAPRAASFRVHATHAYQHTCVLKHWQQLLWNCLGLFKVFSFDSWNILLILNYPKGMDKQIQFTALGHRVPTFPFVQTSCHFT